MSLQNTALSWAEHLEAIEELVGPRELTVMHQEVIELLEDVDFGDIARTLRLLVRSLNSRR